MVGNTEEYTGIEEETGAEEDIGTEYYNERARYIRLREAKSVDQADTEKALKSAGSRLYNVSENNKETLLVKYCGPLGNFEYDPAQFQLVKMMVDPDMDGMTDEDNTKSIYVLKYIGTETDGKKIYIPAGITDISFMFAESDLKSPPSDIPDTVRKMDGTFEGCASLRSAANMNIPAGVTSGAYMFSGCRNMIAGPAKLPDGMEDCSYMFSGCDRMMTGPQLPENWKEADGAFAYCKNLRTKPVLVSDRPEPQYLTLGCTTLDMTEDRRHSTDMMRAKQKYMQKEVYGNKAGSLFNGFKDGFVSKLTFLLDMKAMQSYNRGFFGTFGMVWMLRESGQIGKDLYSSLALEVQSRWVGVPARMIMSAMSAHTQKAAEEKTLEIRAKESAWDTANKNGAVFEDSMADFMDPIRDVSGFGKGYYKKAMYKKSMSGSLFADCTDGIDVLKNYQGMDPLKNARYKKEMNTLYGYRGLGGALYAMRDNIDRDYGKIREDGSVVSDKAIPGKTRVEFADKYKDMFSNYVAYGVAAQQMIRADMSLDAAEKAVRNKGLINVMNYITEDIIRDMRDVQQVYSLLSYGDMRDINGMARSIGMDPVFDIEDGEYEQEKSVEYDRQRGRGGHQGRPAGEFDTGKESDVPDPEP